MNLNKVSKPVLGRIDVWMLAICSCLLLASCGGGSFSRVVVDAGHGGFDRGASRAGIEEKHLALDVATRVEQLLKRRGVPVTMTRSTDRYITLGGRVTIADRIPDSALVSIHFNSATNTSAQGIETYHSRNASQVSRDLASSIQTRLIRKTGATDRGVKSAGFYVLRKTKKPAVLVECGFVSHSGERTQSLQASHRQDLAQGIVDGIMREIRH